MILNHCRGCGCPLDPGERYCEECEEKMLEDQEKADLTVQAAEKKTDREVEAGKCRLKQYALSWRRF